MLVCSLNEEVGRRPSVLAQPGMETEEGLAGALAERILGDKTRHLEMAWWAEVKRKDWSLHGERPVMPFSVMRSYATAAPPADTEVSQAAAGLPAVGSNESHPDQGPDSGAGKAPAKIKAEPPEEESTS